MVAIIIRIAEVVVGDQSQSLDTFAWHTHQVEHRQTVRPTAHHPVEGGQFADPVGGGKCRRSADAGISVGGVGGIEFVGATHPFQTRDIFDGIVNGEGVVARHPEYLVDAQLGDPLKNVLGNGRLAHRNSFEGLEESVLPGDECDHGFAEGVIVITGGGMSGVGEFDEVRVRNLGQEVFNAFGTDDIGELAADQQDGYVKLDRLLLEPFHLDKGVIADRSDECRIPVPVPPAVAVAQVLLQPVKVPSALAVRQVFRDRVGGMFKGLESVHVAGHEIPDAVTSFALESRHHINQNEFCHDLGTDVVRGHDSRQTAHAGTDQHHRTTDLFNRGLRIAGECVDVVLTGRRTVTVAVTAGVECDHVKSMIGQHLSGVLPREPVLSTAVQHENGRLAVIGRAAIPFVGHQCQ